MKFCYVYIILVTSIFRTKPINYVSLVKCREKKKKKNYDYYKFAVYPVVTCVP